MSVLSKKPLSFEGYSTSIFSIGLSLFFLDTSLDEFLSLSILVSVSSLSTQLESNRSLSDFLEMEFSVVFSSAFLFFLCFPRFLGVIGKSSKSGVVELDSVVITGIEKSGLEEEVGVLSLIEAVAWFFALEFPVMFLVE